MIATIFTDGGSRGNPGLAASAFLVYDEQGGVIDQEGIFLGQKTNNEAEYGAFLASVKWLIAHKQEKKITEVQWKLDSLLVVEQISRHWKIKEARILTLVQSIWQELETLGLPYKINHVPRAQNAAADAIVNQVLDAQT